MKKLTKFLLVLGSVLFALGLCETGLRIRMSPQTALRMEGNEDFWQYVWLTHRRNVNPEDQFTRDNPRLIYSPSLGWKPRPNYRPSGGFNDGFNLNSRGLRGLKEYSYEKAPAERRIVVVGDSFTFGSFDTRFMPRLPDEAIYPALLERALPGVSVINLGVDGYGTDQQVLMLREEGFKYNPDLVLASLYVDDLRRVLLSFRDYAKPKFALRDSKLLLTGVPVPPPEELERTLRPRIPRSYLWAVVRPLAQKYVDQWARLGKLDVDELNEAILNALRDDVQHQGAKLLLVAIPPAGFEKPVDRSERFLGDWCRRNAVPVLMLRNTFLALSAADQAKLYVGHWTAFGHQVAAEAIHKKILEEKLLPELPKQEAGHFGR